MTKTSLYKSCYELADIAREAQALAPFLSKCPKLMLYAPMGSGKTTLSLAIMQALGHKEQGSSPSFSLVNSYALPQGQEAYHIDLYRLNSSEEALDIGIEDMLYDAHICLIEWPELIEAYLPPSYLALYLQVQDDGQRRLELYQVELG